MNGGGKPALRIDSTGQANFEGLMGAEVHLRLVSRESVLLMSAFYNGRAVSLARDNADVRITIVSGVAVLTLAIVGTLEGQNVDLVELDESGDRHRLASFQVGLGPSVVSYTIRGV